jgi:hypothetical protein
MSKFIASSVNYSETNVLKSKYLSNILELYNQEILSESKKLVNNVQKYIIPNNNNKYYLLIVNKNIITSNNANAKYKIFYFFPDSAQQEQNNTLNKNVKSDFYVEIDNYKTSFSSSNYLFEGYLYTLNDQKHFLISDVLAVDSKIIKCDYSLRYALIHELIANQQLNNLNGHLNINVHSIFELNADSYEQDIQTSQIFTIFKNNFVFKEEISTIEYVNEVSFKKQKEILQVDNLKGTKIITKGKYIDVYNVFNTETNNMEGILYVKGLKESKHLYQLSSFSYSFKLNCKFNNNFKKWQPIF